MRPRTISLKDKILKKVSLANGQQLTGKVIGVMRADRNNYLLLLDSGKHLSLLKTNDAHIVAKIERGSHITIKMYKQKLQVEHLKIQTLKLKREI